MNGRFDAITVQVPDPAELGAWIRRHCQLRRWFANGFDCRSEEARDSDFKVRQQAGFFLAVAVPPVGQKCAADEIRLEARLGDSSKQAVERVLGQGVDLLGAV
jgi:hypothetical protein